MLGRQVEGDFARDMSILVSAICERAAHDGG